MLLTARIEQGIFMWRHIGLVLASSLAASIGALGVASAADMPAQALPMKAPPVVVYNWTGCYGGLNGGWKEGRFRESVDAPAGLATGPGGAPVVPFPADHIDLPRLTADSGAVGGQLGCRWETPQHWVFGVEGDFDWTDLHGTIVSPAGGPGGTFVPGDSFGNRARWQSSLRGVAGRSFDKWLLYVTGGLATTDVEMSSNYIATTVVPVGGAPILFPASAGSDSKVLYGFTVGAGAAYAFAPNWDIGAEYRYSQYNGADFNLGPVAAFCFGGAVATCTNSPTTGHKDLSTQEVLFKLNYHFGPSAVVAKY
jgi:outer membrane immunogenic protein